MLDIAYYIRRNEDLKRKKQPWLNHWQLVAEYVMSIKSDFTHAHSPGEQLNHDLFDGTASKSCQVAAASMIGALWPSGAQSFRFKRPHNIPNSKLNNDYYIWAHTELQTLMDDPDAGQGPALEEYMRDQMAFGTSGLAVFEGEGDSFFLFKAWSVKQMSIDEGKNGKVDTVYFEMEQTVHQVCAEYGDRVSAKTRELYMSQKLDEKVKVLIAIQPRLNRVPGKVGAWNMAWESVHIEVDQKHVLRDSGFDEMSVLVGRFMKNILEAYGRSCGMDALPDILEVNAIREAEIVAVEKILSPPLGVLDDGKLGGSTIDTSAGAINVFNMSGRMTGSQPPVFPLFTVGDLKPVKDRIEELKQSIANHFLIDRLLDLNNETPMTLGEAQLRDKLRGMTLGSTFNRQIVEVFSPMIRRCFNMALKKGKLGVVAGSPEEAWALLNGETPMIIPSDIANAMMKGQDVYQIEYLTPAQRMVDAEQAQGIINAWKFANEVAATRPDAQDYLDEDMSIQLLTPMVGGPRAIIRDKETVDKIRDQRAQAQQEQREFEMKLKAAETAAKVAKATQEQPQGELVGAA